MLSRSAPDPQAVRVLLDCLNHLRSRQLDALESGNAAPDDQQDPTLWRKVIGRSWTRYSCAASDCEADIMDQVR